MCVFMPFINQDILSGGVVWFSFNGTEIFHNLLEKVAVMICTIKTCVVKSLFKVVLALVYCCFRRLIFPCLVLK